MRHALIAMAFLLVGCQGAPKIQTGEIVWYERQPDLSIQAEAYRAHSISLIDSSGVYLYRGFENWGPTGDAFKNYADSHDIADWPAWQGDLMAALSFEWAVTGRNNDALLRRLAQGYAASFEITGVEGLMTRCVWPDYTGPRLSWMDTPEERPTKFWTQGTGGRWYRNGVAKNHTNLTMFGCAVPLFLDREGKITLTGPTRELLKRVLVGVVKHLKAGGWQIKDVDGKTTEFGDLRPDVTFGPTWPALTGLPNGFNRAIILHGLRSASFYDAELAADYERLAPLWAPGIGQSMELVGDAVKAIGHWKIGKPSFSDMQAFASASLSLIAQEPRREIAKHYSKGMVGLWEYMRYERNAPFTLCYVLVRPSEARVADVIEDLRQFPLPRQKGYWNVKHRDSSSVQPLGNRPTNANYYKSNPFRRVILPDGPLVQNRHPDTGALQLHGGQDFLVSYWLGRYLGVVPEK